MKGIKGFREKCAEYGLDLTINLGFIIGLITVIIAYQNLRVDKRDLKTKVEDLGKIVETIEQEKEERFELSLRDIRNSTDNLNHTNKAYDYIRTTNSNFRKMLSNQYFELTIVNEHLIKIALADERISKKEKRNLKKFLEVSRINVALNLLTESFYEKIDNFDKENSPNRDSTETDEYSKQMKVYLPKLKQYIKDEQKLFQTHFDSLNSKKMEIYESDMVFKP